MELSSRAEYALLALLELSKCRPEAKPLKVGEIAAIQSIPCRYLDEILILLRQSGLVQSQRGIKGGYLLAKEPQQITLLEIVMAVEGDVYRRRKEMKTSHTPEKKAIIATWKKASQLFQITLSNYTLQDLWEQCNSCQ